VRDIIAGISTIFLTHTPGLLGFLKSIQKPCNLKKFSGHTIGIDAYGWLHRGAVGCAIDLTLNKQTSKLETISLLAPAIALYASLGLY
jgi:exonuclease-1